MTFKPADNQDASITDSLAMRKIGATVSPKDIAEAVKPYGLDKTPVKGKSDQQLRDMAVNAVIKWYQKQKADAKAATKAASSSASPRGTAAGSAGGTSSGARGVGGSTTTTSGSRTAGLPNTATGSGGTAKAPLLAHILTAAERMAQEQLIAQHELALKQQRARELAAADVAKQKAAMLLQAGLQNAIVPTYALTSTANLQAWITQQLLARKRAAVGTGFRA